MVHVVRLRPHAVQFRHKTSTILQVKVKIQNNRIILITIMLTVNLKWMKSLYFIMLMC